ncbi:AEC family transporter [Lacrimispora sp. NSJ-141]|uniref:AEC family transporter n=1 Tax=Lientehia hominis TaxID=2897778 RepID=A0AAP2RKQ3_9FIRM|nr:AEC family transporter [Lientehia hominis]MCD2492578.1 AEC family transporter [Lientehia hominis]
MDAGIVFQKMLVLLILILVGYLTYKLGILGKDTGKQISGLIVKVLNPAIMLASAMGDRGSVTGKELSLAGVFAFFMFVLLIGLGWVLGAVFGRDREEKRLYNLMTVFSNLGFIGIPVTQAIYGEAAVIYVSIFVLEYNCFFYTYGMMLVDRASGRAGRGFSPKSLLNSGMAACVITLLLTVFRTPVPFFISGPISYLGDACVPMALLAIGVSLAQNDWRTIFLDWRIYLFSILKLLAVPVICVLFMRLIPADRTIRGVTAVMLAMPVGNMAAMAAETAGMDSAVCSRGVTITTVLTLFTVPLVAALI